MIHLRVLVKCLCQTVELRTAGEMRMVNRKEMSVALVLCSLKTFIENLPSQTLFANVSYVTSSISLN